MLTTGGPADVLGDSSVGASADTLGNALAGAVRALAGARPLVLLLDVDGTLAPIAPRPEDARVPGETLDVLGALAAAPDVRVALVTGRAPAEARRLVPVPGLWVVGNHGAEQEGPDGAHAVDPRVAAWGPALRAALADVAAELAGVPGAFVEDKRWSASVHYRLAAPEHAPHVVAAARRAGERAGLRVSHGKMVVELRAPVDVDKGTAGAALARALGADAPGAAVLAAGDDATDEDLFCRLAAARLGGRPPVTIRVGAPDVPTAAVYRVGDPAGLLAVLQAVAAGREEQGL